MDLIDDLGFEAITAGHSFQFEVIGHLASGFGVADRDKEIFPKK